VNPDEGGRSESLVDRLVRDFRTAIAASTLSPGARAPSVRELARQRNVSVFTASEALNRLVAEGLLEARPGKGYFVAARASAAPACAPAAPEPLSDSIWSLRAEQRQDIDIDAGCGWLRPEWTAGASFSRALKEVAREPLGRSVGYGSALGLRTLRAQLSRTLFGRSIEASADQILLTQGATQGLDLAIRTLLQPGDQALLESPCYPGLVALLRLQGVTPVYLPRTANGPDVEALKTAAAHSRATVFFTNTTLHNPTGSSTAVSVTHGVLETARQFNLTIVEDDPFWDLHPQPPPTLASLDGLRSVMYVSSFSKTISPSLRVGYIAADRGLIDALARTKVTCSLGSSAIAEELVLHVLSEGHFRRHLAGLRDKLLSAHERVAPALKQVGFQLFCEPHAGLFLWAQTPTATRADNLAARALQRRILLAPGAAFSSAEDAEWFRFNVSYADDPRLLRALEELVA
jgi:DNA-binding transcriptional MocR family regulator